MEEIPHTQVIKTEDSKPTMQICNPKEQEQRHCELYIHLFSSVVPSEYYGQLQQIWNKAVEMNQALIVLKKELPKD